MWEFENLWKKWYTHKQQVNKKLKEDDKYHVITKETKIHESNIGHREGNAKEEIYSCVY